MLRDQNKRTLILVPGPHEYNNFLDEFKNHTEIMPTPVDPTKHDFVRKVLNSCYLSKIILRIL